jgi:poly [ADP-ribose] polymerase
MPNIIETAKTGRAGCRTCKQPIAKGDLRFGEEVPNAFSAGDMTYNWHHLPCAAKKKPSALKQALDDTDQNVPDKEALMKTIEENAKNEKPTVLPYAEYAPTARASCVGCSEKIEKGHLRVAVESEDDGSPFPRSGPRYLHVACAPEHAGDAPDEFFEKVKNNSKNVETKDMQELKAALQG